MNEELAGWFDKISKLTGQPVDQLVSMALWDFVSSFDWDFEELREGNLYQPAARLTMAQAAAVG